MRLHTQSHCARCPMMLASPFGLLDEAGLQQVERERLLQVYKPGQGIFYAGEQAHTIHVIRSGRVKIYRLGADGEEQVLRLLGPGEILGYRALFADEPYQSSAEALEETLVCTLPRVLVLDLVRRYSDLALGLLKKLSCELRISEDLVMNLVGRPVRQRAAALILSLASTGAREGIAPTSAIRLRRKDMAKMIGTTPETFSRILRDFSDRGLIGLTRTELSVREPVGLRRAAGERVRLDAYQLPA